MRPDLLGFVSSSILVWLATCAAGAADAAVRNVSTTAELQAAVAAAQPGDTIVLAPGVYRPAQRLGVSVAVTLQGDPTAPSIIDGGGENILALAGDGDTVVENLTLRNGRTGLVWAGSRGRSSLLIRGVTITGNTDVGVTGGDGGGLLTMVNSTVAENLSGDPAQPAAGFGISCGSIAFRNVTISGNDRGLHVNFPCNTDVHVMQNVLIAGNAVDCVAQGSVEFEGATSLDGDGTCAAEATVGGRVFTTVVNPGLGALADNGGPTLTMALSALSPAVDGGSSCSEPFDQRGAVRDAACDIGAFERATAARMTSATGAGPVEVRALSGDFATLLTFHPVAEADMPNQAGKPAGVTFPYGFFEWSMGPLLLAGGALDVQMTFPGPVAAPVQYWKVVSGVWTDVCLQLPCVVDGDRLTVTFRDGGLGDLDGIANAVIVDPGGLGAPADVADGTAPVVECGSPDAAWHPEDVNIACTARDDESGLANPADAAFSLITHVPAGEETSSAETDSREVCDAAGNCAAAGPIGGIRVDKKAPAIAITSPTASATYPLGGAVMGSYSCADGGSGVATCAGPVASGAAIDTQSAGTKTFTVQSTDAAGNVSTTSVTYEVECRRASLGVSPATVAAGGVVTVTAGLRSCSTAPETISLRFTLSGPVRAGGCDATRTTMFTTPPLRLRRGFDRSLSFPFRVPRSTCAGEYSVTLATLLNGSVADSTSATLTVVR